jgi:uncharacterized protein (TIGR02217 family)
MSFLETPRFPENVSFGAVGGPGYSTDVVVVQSGQESRNGNWSQSRARYEVSHAARLPAEYNPLKAFFRAVKGKLHGFRFKDWSDYAATVAEGILIETATPDYWQLYKVYSAGSLSDIRIIQKPVAGSVTISGGGTYSLDTTTGLVHHTAGSEPTVWAGQFDIPCRFDVDEMRGEILNKSGADFVMGWNSIQLVEIRT